MKINGSTQIQQDDTTLTGVLEGFEKVDGGIVYSVFVPSVGMIPHA